MKAPNHFVKDCENAIATMEALLEDNNESNVVVAAMDLKTYYNYPHERLELTEEETVVDNKVFNLSQRVEEELGIRLLEVNTY